jgi:N,N-dimethylformamidase
MSFRVSCEAAGFDVQIVRLYQGDDRPEAPPFREELIPAHCAGRYPGRVQPLRTGSYLRIPHRDALNVTGFTCVLWVFPTAIGRGQQGIIGWRAAPNAGWNLSVGEDGRLLLEAGAARIESAQRLESSWHLVVVRYDAHSGEATLYLRRCTVLAPHLDDSRPGHAVTQKIGSLAPARLDLLIGALHGDGSRSVTACFNGKVASPALYGRALALDELETISRGEVLEDGLLARWDLSAWPYGTTVPDRGAHGLDALVINNPMRAVSGPMWDGTASHFLTKPAHYDAIYLHDDDLDDAGWEVDFTWQIPRDLPSGVYAARLRAGEDEDYLPCVVRPMQATARTLLVLPTFTYQAYANERFHAHPGVDWSRASDRPLQLSPQDAFSAGEARLGCSIYDAHSDGSYCCYSSLRRPVVNFRPKLVSYWNGAGRHFTADLYLVDWLDRMGFAHDVATDHDLHAHGDSLLWQYDVVLLGSHPEYVSVSMRDALEAHVARGGRLMYLGGNGCWWVTDVDPARPHVIEVRKWLFESGVAGFGVGPGEEYLGASGRRGGTWRAAGRAPETLFGVGYTAQGFCAARPFKRMPASFDPRVAFIFEGIGADEPIGNFGLALGGAAGDEFDRAYPGASPPGTLVLASSENHPAEYCVGISVLSYQTPEEQAHSVRADVTYYEAPAGGAVFAAGSMCWCTSLPVNNYDNNVSRITANVLRKFLHAA